MKTVQQLIDEALAPKPRERSGKWNPSSFGMCYRKQFWNRKDEPKSNPPDERGLRVFAAGQLFHNFVQNLMKQENHYQIEVVVESEDVKGFADMVNEDTVVDIKSQHSKSFWWMAKKDCDIKVEKYSNWLQVLYYARELGKKFGKLVFVSKDDLCIQEYVQPLDDWWLKSIELELSILRFIWGFQNNLPPAEPRCDSKIDKKTGVRTYWQCLYCDWLNKCKAVEQAEGREHPCQEEK